MKNVTVTINGVKKEIEKREYDFKEIVSLATGSFDETKRSYTVVITKKNDDGNKHIKTLSLGEKIELKEGMRINVDTTNRS